jgi:arylsulfatase A-like enzyme
MSNPLPRLSSLGLALALLGGCGQQSATPAESVTAAASPSPAESAAETTAIDTRPNILYIMADDLSYSDLGVYGGEIPTPNLDLLANNGMLLTSFYTGLTCSPTRSMLMSGMDSHLAGLGVMGAPSRPDHQDQDGYLGYLNFNVASLADLMTDAGYNTYMTGKWHLGLDDFNGAHARGFKKSFVSLDGAAHLGPWDWRGPQNAKYRDNGELVEVGADFYSTRVYTERMLQYIEEDRADGKPFFAWLAYTAPHWPIQAPRESIARFHGNYDAGYEALYESRFTRLKELQLIPADAQPIPHERFNPRWDSLSAEEKAVEAREMEIYAAMVSDLDIYVGQVIDYLKEIGEFDNTFIIFSSDNGAESGATETRANIVAEIGKSYDHSLDNLGAGNTYVMYGRNWASATEAPFYRHKATGFEGGIRVPAFVHYPALVAPGTRSNGPAHVMDLLPTFLALAGSEHPGNQYRGQTVLPPQGKSLLPQLRGEAATVRENGLLGFELHGHRSVRVGDWKLVWDHAGPAEARRWYLFNLLDDPFEQNDLSATNPEKLQEMLANWDAYQNSSGVIY